MTFLNPPKFSNVGMKAQRGEGAQIILLGDNICGKEVILRPISFLCVGVLNSVDRVYTYFQLAPSLTQHN